MNNEVGMNINDQSKAGMDSVNTMRVPAASQGARRATEDAAGAAPTVEPAAVHMEVVAHAKRRRFSNADKRRILGAADRCTRPGGNR